MANEGGIEMLIHLLASDNEHVQRQSAKALANLGVNSTWPVRASGGRGLAISYFLPPLFAHPSSERLQYCAPNSILLRVLRREQAADRRSGRYRTISIPRQLTQCWRVYRGGRGSRKPRS